MIEPRCIYKSNLMQAHALEARIARVEGVFDQVNERLGGIERRIDSFENLTVLRFDQIDRRFNWLTGIVVGSWLTMMATQLTAIFTILYHC